MEIMNIVYVYCCDWNCKTVFPLTQEQGLPLYDVKRGYIKKNSVIMIC